MKKQRSVEFVHLETELTRMFIKHLSERILRRRVRVARFITRNKGANLFLSFLLLLRTESSRIF